MRSQARIQEMFDRSTLLGFERQFLWLRLAFLLTPFLMVVAYGPSTTPAAIGVDTVVALDCGLVWILLRFFPDLVFRLQLPLRVVDLVTAYVALYFVHTAVGNAYYDSVYLFFVVAATATHGRRGTYWVSAGATAAVLLGRFQLIAAGVFPFHLHHITDTLFYALLFVATGSVTEFLMKKTGEVVALRQQRAEQAIRESEERYRGLFDNATDMVYVHDLDGRFLACNQAAEEMLGYSLDELPELNIADIVVPDQIEDARRMTARKVAEGGSTTYELELLDKDGRRMAVEISSQVIKQAGRPVAIQGIARDITERKRAEAALAHQALHDSLTELPNRALLQDRLQHAISAAHRDHTPFALLLLDLDRFKEVNDTFGHQYGDLLLQEVGTRLQIAVRESDTVARLGGDEFALLLPATDRLGATVVGEKALRELERPFVVEGHSLHVGASVGIALYPVHSEDASTLMRQADVAMYVAKRAGGGYSIYVPEEDQNSPSRLALISELQQAIEHERLSLHYQPKVDLTTGRVNSVEALIRWHHPRHGSIPPSDFIPLAEHTGLIRPLSLWVLGTALEQCRRWHDEGIQIRVAVNLSRRNLHDILLPNIVAGLLRACHGDPSWLEIEITESAIMADPDRAMEILKRLHDMGITISIDDFGTGYSSLGSLKRLPVDEIKIDRSFVTELLDNDENSFIVQSIIDLGHNLKLEVVAEGVENLEVYRTLEALGCDTAQGYYLSRPLPPGECAEFLQNTNSQALPPRPQVAAPCGQPELFFRLA